ncbi:gluconokinase [Phreatobacter sp.]|uniref:gluconokinase n=1 Tax=Phreatobacter sp. TaxID=1966341 RepID=UPI0025F4A0B4|nr:gluconokinase [Phreatobacter sp.]
MTARGAQAAGAGRALPTALVVMGVSGSGKSTVGIEIARRLGWDFRDGDAFHPPSNVAKMRSGAPLTDDDRWPWLDAIAAEVAARENRGDHVVIACSALKRAYRDRLRASRAAIRFVHLAGSFELIDGRMQARQDHFMPASLLKSQFATLEPLEPDEDSVTVPVNADPSEIAGLAIAALRA